MIRVLDARLFHRAADGDLTEFDIGPLLAEQPEERPNPIARLLGVNGGGGNGGLAPPEAFARTAGFALEDLRRLTDEIGPGDYAAAILVEHVWAARLRDVVRAAGGRLLGQGFLTPEVVMVVGAEIQARADAEAALELAEAARGSALVEALSVLVGRDRGSAKDAARAAACIRPPSAGHGARGEPAPRPDDHHRPSSARAGARRVSRHDVGRAIGSASVGVRGQREHATAKRPEARDPPADPAVAEP
jgi:hypothetical protein